MGAENRGKHWHSPQHGRESHIGAKRTRAASVMLTTLVSLTEAMLITVSAILGRWFGVLKWPNLGWGVAEVGSGRNRPFYERKVAVRGGLGDYVGWQEADS